LRSLANGDESADESVDKSMDSSKPGGMIINHVLEESIEV